MNMQKNADFTCAVYTNSNPKDTCIPVWASVCSPNTGRWAVQILSAAAAAAKKVV